MGIEQSIIPGNQPRQMDYRVETFDLSTAQADNDPTELTIEHHEFFVNVVDAPIRVRFQTPNGPLVTINSPRKFVSASGDSFNKIWLSWDVAGAGYEAQIVITENFTAEFSGNEPATPTRGIVAGENTDVDTAAEILAASQFCRSVLVQAALANTGVISVGDETSQTIELVAGQALTLEVDDISDIYVIASVVNQAVNWILQR